MSHLPYLRFILVILLLVSAFSGFTTDELIQENTEQTQRPNSNTEIKKQVIDVNGRSLYFVEVYKDRNKGPKPLVIFVQVCP